MKIAKHNCRTDIADRFDAETNRSARISCALGYLFFFVPTTMHPESKFARYHSNQAFILLLWMTLGVALAAAIPYVGPFLLPVMIAFGLFSGIRGMVLALRCQAKHIPLIGRLILIEYENSYTFEL